MLHWVMYATLLVDPRAGRGEVSGGVVTELRGGLAPIQPGRPEVASFGDIDYTAASLIFQGPQANVANTPVLSFAIGDAEVRFVGRLAPRHTLTVAVNAGYRIALDPQDQPLQMMGAPAGTRLLSYP